MVQLFIDIDGVIRDIGCRSKVSTWGAKIHGLGFVEYINKNLHLLKCPEVGPYFSVLQEWLKLADSSNLTFLSCQPENWQPYTEVWLEKHFPGVVYTFTETPNDKLQIVSAARGYLIDDYPRFESFDRVITVDCKYNKGVNNQNFRIKNRIDFLLILAWAYTKDLLSIAKLCHNIAKSKGWWDRPRNDGELIALMHSELSEALEELRDIDSKDSLLAEELSDCCIRIFDYCFARNLNLAASISCKIVHNMDRPYKHNKKF